MERGKLFEAPEIGKGNMLFTLKEITYIPESPRMKEPVTIKGKVELFGMPFFAPIWVQARVTYPETWWGEIIPIIGSPTVAEGAMVIGGSFEISFPRGFEREGEFLLEVAAYGGPTYSIDKITLPPFPPVVSEETTFIVGGEVPPEEVGFRNFRILSYSKNSGTPVTAPGVLELEVGDRCRVNVGLDHKNGDVTGKFHAAIWKRSLWDPHDEVLNADKTFSVPASTDWEPWEGYIDIIITSAISPGTEYGLYVKIMGITGGDIFTEYLENVIIIKGAPPVGECSDLKITSYDSASPPRVLKVSPGDTIRVTSEFDYVGPATTGKLYTALWHPSWYDPHDEVAHGEKSLTLPDSPEGSYIKRYVDIKVPSGFAGTDFGLYTKVTGNLKDAMSPYYENIIEIVGLPPTSDIADWDFRATGGAYNLGDSVPFDASYKYKGKAQGGWLTISLGTGIYPSFSTKYTFPRKPITFEEAMDWTPNKIGGSFVLPTTLEPGQTYSVRAKLETADGVQETDTDWGIITITEMETLEVRIDPVGAGTVTTDPAPAGGIENNWLFPYGTEVWVTAHPKPGYVFNWWSGEMTDTPDINAPVYPMTEHRRITAHFKKEVAPPPPVEKGFSVVLTYYEWWVFPATPYRGTAKYWFAQFSPYYWSGYIDVTKKWVTPYDIGESMTDFFSLVLVDKDYNVITSWSKDGVTFGNGKTYECNALTQDLAEIK